MIKLVVFELVELFEVELLFDGFGGDDELELLYLGVFLLIGSCFIIFLFCMLEELEVFCVKY